MVTRYQTTESARFFISDAESVLVTRYQTTESANFFISDAESVMDTRHQTTESANFFFSMAFRENTLVKTLQNGAGKDRKIANYVKKKIVLPVPYNTLIVDLIHAIEESYEYRKQS